MRISDWSSDVCSSDLEGVRHLSRLVRGDLSPSSRRIEDEAVAPLRGQALRRAMAGASLLYSTVYGPPCTVEINADGNLARTAGYAAEICRSREPSDGNEWFR